ncbi:hypothetical protein QFZ99_004740 [Paraburkholderia atlantica]|uniref:EthD domain-containing protein n=1 Tax=Paraburkholderia atlantica TaxID=2654982 RepID=UPI003D24DFF7
MASLVEETVLRPPHIQTRQASDEPLTALFSLLSRADSTRLGERRLGSGFTLDTSGRPSADPAAEAKNLAFESDANVNFEHWSEYWRKVHGVRFTHVEEDSDESLERLLRYSQLHRFAAGPTNTDQPPYRVPVDSHGALWPTIIGHVAPYKRPSWDGVAFLNFATPDDIPLVLANERIRTKIIPEDRAMFRDLAPVLARQHVIIPSPNGTEAVILVKLHRRRTDASRAEFQRWWREEHAALVSEQARFDSRVKRYVQLHNVGPTEADAPFYHPDAVKIDGIGLYGFDNVAAAEEFLRSDAGRVVASHESTLIDPAASEFWTTIAIPVVERLHGEISTR